MGPPFHQNILVLTSVVDWGGQDTLLWLKGKLTPKNSTHKFKKIVPCVSSAIVSEQGIPVLTDSSTVMEVLKLVRVLVDILRLWTITADYEQTVL